MCNQAERRLQLNRRITMEFEGYCVKCREKRMVADGKVEVNDKGRRMAKGVCPVCGTKITRFLPAEEK
jgi:hypothetical protein